LTVYDCQPVGARRSLLPELAQTTASGVASISNSALQLAKGARAVQIESISFDVTTTPLDLVASDRREDSLLNALRKRRQRFDDSMLVASKFGCGITIETIKRLLPPGWLNSEIVTFFFEWWAVRIGAGSEHNMPTGPVKVYFSSTYFYSKLFFNGEYCYKEILKWTKKIDIFALDMMIIPINLQNYHWFLAIINFVEQRMEIYDSQGTVHSAVIEALFRYLQDEHRNKKGCELDISSWSREPLLVRGQRMPHQRNGYDCGVFMCMYGAYKSINRPFDFTQIDIPRIRAWMMRIICETGGFVCS
jgi:sentrin-specific protease 1